MLSKYKFALEQLKSTGWSISLMESKQDLPENIKSRYSWLPDEIKCLIVELKTAVSPDEKIWIQGMQDFSGAGLSAFKWNEWEQMSLDAAEGNYKLTDAIKTFWDFHFPIIFSVRSDYAYFAIQKSDFRIVYGHEPEFEEPSIIASSLLELLDMLAKKSPTLSQMNSPRQP